MTITQKQYKLNFENNGYKLNIIQSEKFKLNVNKVIIREVLKSDNFYSKTEANALLDLKLDKPLEQEWEDFEHIIES